MFGLLMLHLERIQFLHQFYKVKLFHLFVEIRYGHIFILFTKLLSSHIKNYISFLIAVHDLGDFRNNFNKGENLGTAKKLNEGYIKFGSYINPLVKIHPIT
jgi:hypothetical protein